MLFLLLPALHGSSSGLLTASGSSQEFFCAAGMAAAGCHARCTNMHEPPQVEWHQTYERIRYNTYAAQTCTSRRR